MLRIIPIMALALACGGASAQSVYKCTVNGKAEYSGEPCKQGSMKVISVPVAPKPDVGRAEEYRREKLALAELEKARTAREEAAQKLAADAERGNSPKEQRCAKLLQEKQMAEENAARAPGFKRASMRDTARRLGEAMALECGS